jgi:predicted nuclease with TOPRIM domain
MQALDQLNSKLNMLLKKYTAMEAENKRLKDTIAKQVKTEEKLNKRLASLEQGMAGVNLGTVVASDDEKENMRRQLDGLITEIDGILNTMND